MGYVYCGWTNDIYKKPCYEILNNGGDIYLPSEYKNGKLIYPYGKYCYNIKQLATYRKSNINKPCFILSGTKDKDYKWMGEPCKVCQIKKDCDEGFPNWFQKLYRKYFNKEEKR